MEEDFPMTLAATTMCELDDDVKALKWPVFF
jgi:hypothetical protein